jgi:hypothetical protein
MLGDLTGQFEPADDFSAVFASIEAASVKFFRGFDLYFTVFWLPRIPLIESSQDELLVTAEATGYFFKGLFNDT